MQTIKKKDIKKYKPRINEGGFDNSERLGDSYQEAIEEFLEPILKRLDSIKAEGVVMKVYDNMFPEMMEGNDVDKHVRQFIKTNYPKLYDRANENGVTEKFESKKQQRFFYAKANDDSLSDKERAKWKKWADEYSDETNFDELKELEETQELDEFVNGMGASISGDKPNVNNSEIETAPQATSDDHNTAAIQPNRYLYNVDSVGPRGNGTVSTENYEVAKGKFINLLEDVTGPQISSDKTMTDFNNNDIVDINELPSNVARKLTDLVDSVVNNNLSDEQVDIVIQFVNAKLNA